MVERRGFGFYLCGGMIGSLLRLVRAAAIQAVLDGSEAITKGTLESIPVDIASDDKNKPR